MVAGDDWQKTLDSDGINSILVESNSVVAKFLGPDPAWKEIYRDDKAVIFIRNTVLR